jgi:beta-phosphoglucomutase-like phosphatase (HAD superfamily)
LIEAVIFDLDGVIVDSEQVWDRVRRGFVQAHGGTWREDSSRHMMGLSTREWAHYLTADLGVQLSDDEVADQVIEEMKRDYERHLPMVAGAAAAVRRLSAGWRLAVASGSPISLIDAVLEGGSIQTAFHVLVSSDEVAAGKPSPDVYLEAARRLKVSIQRCAVVEDSSNGIKSAATAGASIIAVPNRMYPPDESVLRLADVMLADINHLTPQAVSRLNAKSGGR